MAPLEEQAEEEEIQTEDGEDVEPLKLARNPKLPSAADIEAHDRVHIPYRDWCKWCNLGRGRGIPHRHGGGSSVPIVGIDYFFITSEGVKTRKELEFEETPSGDELLESARARGDIIKCMLVRCFESKNIFAHYVPVKGADEEDYAAGLVAAAVLWLGHIEVILKGDNERALQAMIERAMRLLRIKVGEADSQVTLKRLTKEKSAPYDSQSNGGTEVGVMLVRGIFRTLKLCLESHLGMYIPVKHPVLPWLLEHSAFLLNVKSRGSDGLTPWARIKGRPFGLQVIGFGEAVFFKRPVKGPDAQPEGNMGAVQAEGTFIGYNRSTNTYILATPDGQKMESRSVTRRP